MVLISKNKKGVDQPGQPGGEARDSPVPSIRQGALTAVGRKRQRVDEPGPSTSRAGDVERGDSPPERRCRRSMWATPGCFPHMTGEEVVETLSAAVDGSLPATSVGKMASSAMYRLEALANYMVVPTSKGRSGQVLKYIDLTRRGLYEVRDALCSLRNIAMGKESVLHRELEKEVVTLREEVRRLRAGLDKTGRGAKPAPPERKGNRGGGAVFPPATPYPRKEDFPPLPTPTTPVGEEWTEVRRRGRRKAGGEGGGAVAPTPQPRTKRQESASRGTCPPATALRGRRGTRAGPVPTPAQGRGGTRAGPIPTPARRRQVAAPQPVARRRRIPQNPAVTITALPGGRTYAQIMKEARTRVDLPEYGIHGGLSIKRARNGGYLLEVHEGAETADRLARDLEEVLAGVAKVARPVKFAELRLTGLDDSVTPEELVECIRGVSGCLPTDMQLGVIRRAANGMGAVWLRCPWVTAHKLVALRRLNIGWSTVVVSLLEERPLQCFSCLRYGHAAAACKGPKDLAGRCFNCGGAGHVARGCAAKPRCPLCGVVGGRADHRMGGPACPALARAQGRRPPPARRKAGEGSEAVAGGRAPRPAATRRPVAKARAGREAGGGSEADREAMPPPPRPGRAEELPPSQEAAPSDGCESQSQDVRLTPMEEEEESQVGGTRGEEDPSQLPADLSLDEDWEDYPM